MSAWTPSRLGQGINLDLGQTGQQTLNSLVSLSLSLDGSHREVGGTPYDDTLESGTMAGPFLYRQWRQRHAGGRRARVTLNGSAGNTTFIVDGPFDTFLVDAEAALPSWCNDPTGTP